MSMTLISTITSTGSSGTMAFTDIPATYTDLLLVATVKTSQAITYTSLYSYFGTPLASPLRTGYNNKSLYGFGSSVGSTTQTNDTQWNLDNVVPGANATSNTFNSVQLYMPNYAGSLAKTVSIDGTSENDGSAGQGLNGGSNTSANALNRVWYWVIELAGNNFVAGSTASLYGILKGSGGANVS